MAVTYRLTTDVTQFYSTHAMPQYTYEDHVPMRRAMEAAEKILSQRAGPTPAHIIELYHDIPMRDGYILPTFKDVCSADYPSTSAETAPDAESLYMCGNSLGPLSRLGKQYLELQLK